MADENDKRFFWNTLPGILTGIAAVITAVTGIYVAISPHDGSPPSTPTPTPTPINSPVFADNFEGNNLNKWWIVSGNPYSEAKISQNQAHSGKASLYINLVSQGEGDLGVKEVYYNFPKSEQGRLTVWFYDTMDAADSAVALHDASIPFANAKDVKDAAIIASKASVTDPRYYRWRGSAGQSASSVLRSKGWHKFEFDVGDKGTTYLIDDIEVGKQEGFTNLRSIELAIGWMSTGEAYFDDVTFTTRYN